MRKLYKSIDSVLNYHEAWAEGRVIVEHWGVVGERGETRSHARSLISTESTSLNKVLKPAEESGFKPIEVDAQSRAMIEFTAVGFGTPEDIDKLERLRELMDDTLGWTGLGNCDGHSIGSGTMEACCFVVDYEIAKRVIAAALVGTEFSDYTRIYDEDAGV